MLRAADLFCGAGGSTTGAVASGRVKVVYALNHWPEAVRSHEANHPDAKHVCAPVEWIDPSRDVPAIDLLMASPDCTHHSNARGGKPTDDHKRAGGWHVVHWAEALRPRWLVIENVREFMNWGPVGRNGKPLKSKRGATWHAWLEALRSIGYRLEHKILNAADYGEATSRKRLFVIGRLGRRAIPWPKASHRGKHRAAAEIIDWSKPCPSIFHRKRPLSENTLRRIEVGIRKFVGSGDAFTLPAEARGAGEDLPLFGECGSDGAAAGSASPFVVNLAHTKDRADRTYGVDGPLPALTTKHTHALAVPYLVDVNYGGSAAGRLHSVDKPMPTITSRNGRGMVVPFLTKLMESHGIVDIGFRMLEPDELARAMGFPDGYYLDGSKADRVRMIGNAVCPGVMKAICEAISA